MSEEQKQHASRSKLALTKTRIGTANAVILVDEVSDTVAKDAVRVAAVGAIGLALYAAPVVTLVAFGAGKVLVRAGAKRAERKLPSLVDQAEALKAEITRRQQAKERGSYSPEQVVPSGAGA